MEEAMINFQGQKQYLPNKPIKRGIKVWVLANSSNGYFSKLDQYRPVHQQEGEHGTRNYLL